MQGLDSKRQGSAALGAALVILLGPVVVAGFGLAALSILAALTGWGPPGLDGSTPIDFLYGGGGFTATRFVAGVAGLMVGSVALGAIRWGFTGEFEVWYPGE